MTDEAKRVVKKLHSWNIYGQSHERCNVELEAADLIEELTAEIDALKESAKGQLVIVNMTQADRDRWKARCKAAKTAMKALADTVRETHCDDTVCGLCKYDCDMHSGQECPGYYRNDCFEWRGPQEPGAPFDEPMSGGEE